MRLAWRERHRPLRLAWLLVCGSLVGVHPAAAAAPRVADLKPISNGNPFGDHCGLTIPPPFSLLGADVFPKDTATEPHVAVNPVDPDNVVGVWIQDFSLTHVVAATHDGGRSWRRSLVPGIGRCTGGEADAPVDPWLSFGPDGTLYLSSMASDFPHTGIAPTASVLVNRSSDGGTTWSPPAVVQPNDGFYNDKPSVLASATRPGEVFVIFSKRDFELGAQTLAIYLSRSSDRGTTWSKPRAIHRPLGLGIWTWGTTLDEFPDGTLLYAFTQHHSRNELPAVPDEDTLVSVLRSTDRGAHWSAPIVVGRARSTEFGNERVQDPDGGPDAVGGLDPSAAIAADGKAYAVWQDIQSPTSSRIMLSRSADRGRTWSSPAAAISVAGQAFLPTIASGPGRLGMLWYDTRNDRARDNRFAADAWFATSTDDGKTWEQVHLAGPFDLAKTWQDFRTSDFFLGDYVGAAALPDGFATVFPLGPPQAASGKSQAFFARIKAAEQVLALSRPRLGGRHLRVTVAAGAKLRRLHVVVLQAKPRRVLGRLRRQRIAGVRRLRVRILRRPPRRSLLLVRATAIDPHGRRVSATRRLRSP